MKRKFAIINFKKERLQNVKNLLNKFKNFNIYDNFYVFTKEPEKFDNFSNVINIVFPENINSRTLAKNAVNNYFKHNLKFSGFLHVLEDDIKLLNNPSKFLNEIENAMDLLNLNTWFSTVCEKQNYIFKKYIPRIVFKLDDKEDCKKFLTDELLFLTYCSAEWIIYNLNKCPENELYFDTDFTLSFFYIIEFLSRKRENTKNTLNFNFLNQYLTVGSEKNLFERNKELKSSEQNNQNILNKENQLFNLKHINFQPDNDIQKTIELLFKFINK